MAFTHVLHSNHFSGRDEDILQHLPLLHSDSLGAIRYLAQDHSQAKHRCSSMLDTF